MSGDGYCACGELPDNCRCYTVRADGRTRTATLPPPPNQPKRR